MSVPKVSIVMPVYNGFPYIREAVASIAGQDFTDWELLVIDDGSTDGSREWFAGLKDSRFRLLKNEANKGVGYSLRRGFEAATGTYIARMDADDIMLPDRVSKQVAYLDAHPECGVLGTQFELIRSDGTPMRRAVMPLEDADIRFRLLFGVPFCHPTVMVRNSLLKEHAINYSDEAVGEDYKFFVALAAVTQLHTLRGCLLKYRKHEKSVTARKSKDLGVIKLEGAKQYHTRMLTEAFMASEAYAKVTQAYFLQDWEMVAKDRAAFASAMHALTASYIAKNQIEDEKRIYAHTAELIWRALIFKTEGYKKPVELAKLVLEGKHLFFMLPVQLMKRFS